MRFPARELKSPIPTVCICEDDRLAVFASEGMRASLRKEEAVEKSELDTLLAEARHSVYAQQHEQRRIGLIGLNATAQKGQIEFTGSSLMQQFPINEIAMSAELPMKVYNRAISGYKTQDLIDNIGPLVLDIEPSKIFINIGTNDLAAKDVSDEQLLANYKLIIDSIHQRLPETKVYMMAYYPVNEGGGAVQPFDAHAFDLRNNLAIDAMNERLSVLAGEWGCEWIDANEGLRDSEGKLRKELTVEGIHMYAQAYQIIFNNLLPYLA